MAASSTRSSPTVSRPRAAVSRRAGPTTQAYLASQLAAICDVDLKTIHNWCERGDEGEPPSLEHFRTPGGHLRFEHGAVLRFLSRWGYPIPDVLLLDRPHVIYVEPDAARHGGVVGALDLRRPGEEGSPAPAPDTVGPGLWATPSLYLHLWDDPFAALIAVGERSGVV